MKKLIVVSLIAIMVMGFAVAGSAAVDASWLISLRAANSTNVANAKMDVGTNTGHSDNFVTTGGQDAVQSSSSGARGFVTSTVYTANKVAKDSRAPLTTANTIANKKIWNCQAWLDDGTGVKVAGNITLTGWISSTANMTIDNTLDSLYKIVVKVVTPGGTWTVPTGTSVTLGSITAPLYTASFTSTEQALTQSFTVEAWVETVPEPGSMVAMLSGLVGLVGYGIRRRK